MAVIALIALILFRRNGVGVVLLCDHLAHVFLYRWLWMKKHRKWKMLIQAWFLQKGLMIVMGSFLMLGWRKPMTLGYLLVGLGVGSIVIRFVLKNIQTRQELEQRLYQVTIIWKKRYCHCRALLDTGNHLKYGGEPVVLLSPKKAEELGYGWADVDSYRVIPYSSVGCEAGLLHGFVCDCILLEEENVLINKVVVAVADRDLSGKKEYEMLLHPDLLSGEGRGKE